MTDKIVNVKLSETEHVVLKAYAASSDRSMQDVLHDFAMSQLHKQWGCCQLVRYWFQRHGLERDPRHYKPCFGYACYYCDHAEACKAGKTEKLYIPEEGIRPMVTPEALYIFDFDGSSIEPPT